MRRYPGVFCNRPGPYPSILYPKEMSLNRVRCRLLTNVLHYPYPQSAMLADPSSARPLHQAGAECAGQGRRRYPLHVGAYANLLTLQYHAMYVMAISRFASDLSVDPKRLVRRQVFISNCRISSVVGHSWEERASEHATFALQWDLAKPSE